MDFFRFFFLLLDFVKHQSNITTFSPTNWKLKVLFFRRAIQAEKKSIISYILRLIQAKTNERKVLRFGDILAPLSRETKIKYAIARVLRVQSHLFA